MASDPNNSKKQTENKLKDAPMPPLPFDKHIKKEADSSSKMSEIDKIMEKDVMTIDDAQLIIKDLEAKGDKLRKQLDDLYEMSGESPSSVETYLGNPNNFSKEVWEMLNNKRRELVESMKLPPRLKGHGEKFISPQSGGFSPARGLSSSSKDEKSKERRKLSGARRGWIPVR